MRTRASTIALALGLAVGALALGGCSASPAAPLRLASGVSFCVEDASAVPAILAVDADNSTNGPITITAASVGGSNLRTDGAWLLDTTTTGAGATSGVAPFDSVPGWSTRTPVGHATLAAGRRESIAVTMSFPGGASSASARGITVTYREGDGGAHTVRSNVRARFKASC